MELTTLFRACVKTIRTRNKALGSYVETDKNSQLGLGVSKKSSKNEFSLKAKEIVCSIRKMRDFLIHHRKDYINMNFVMYEASNMAESERDQIDRDALKFMQTCKEVIKNLRKEAKTQPDTQQGLAHKEAVIEILESYLKGVCNIFSELKAIRVKRTVDKQKLIRLETSFRVSKSLTNAELAKEKNSEQPRPRENSATSIASITPQERLSVDVEEPPEASNANFSPEEIQLFEQENQRLYEEMNNMVDEVRQIEGKVIEISRLQEVFSEKVLEQEQESNKISNVTVGTTENIKEANEELRQAMRKNAGFRLWILFILIVLSFTILFLNWYNP